MDVLSMQNSVVSPFESAAVPARAGRDVAKASKDFEAILVGQLLEKLRGAFSLDETGQSDPRKKTLTGLADQALAMALSARGGFGIAAMVGQALIRR